MAETGSTRVRRRINTLFASISTKGGRRVPHSPPWPPLLSRTRKAKARYTVWLRGPGGKRYCAELVLTAIAPPPTPPYSAFPAQAGRHPLLHYRPQHTR